MAFARGVVGTDVVPRVDTDLPGPGRRDPAGERQPHPGGLRAGGALGDPADRAAADNPGLGPAAGQRSNAAKSIRW